MTLIKLIIAAALTLAVVLGIAVLADKFYFMRKFYEATFEKVRSEVTLSVGTLLFMIPLTFASIPYVYSDGVKTGSITKFTKKGFIFKTWEGQLNLGGMTSNGDGGMVANVWNFSVTDEVLAKKLQETQGRVSIIYDELILVPVNQGLTNYIAKKLK